METEKLTSIEFMMATGVFHDENQALLILTASLKALRNRLSKVEAFHLGTMLPESLRDAYFEGWHNGQRQAESIIKSDFLSEVESHLKNYEEHSLTELVPVALKAVFKMIGGEQAEYVMNALPKSMQDIFEDRQSMD